MYRRKQKNCHSSCCERLKKENSECLQKMKPHVFSLPTRSYVSIMSSMNPVLRHANTWFIHRPRGMEVGKTQGNINWS